jgi:membrane protease YdiL (CAAX protease family)
MMTAATGRPFALMAWSDVTIRVFHNGVTATTSAAGGMSLSGAELVEELVFRGLVLRSFRSRLNVPSSLLIQGILFGCAHADVRFGAGNIGLLIVLSVAGVSLGMVAVKCRRNGPNMVAHAFMNGFVFFLLYAGSH